MAWFRLKSWSRRNWSVLLLCRCKLLLLLTAWGFFCQRTAQSERQPRQRISESHATIAEPSAVLSACSLSIYISKRIALFRGLFKSFWGRFWLLELWEREKLWVLKQLWGAAAMEKSFELPGWFSESFRFESQ
jgi:hypothetical protein